MSHGRTRRLVVASLTLFGATCTTPAVARAEDAKTTEAREHLRKGQRFYEEEAFEAARAEFQRAWEQTRSHKILFNLALVSNELKDFATAYRHYQDYLRAGGAEIPDARRADVELALAGLRQRIAVFEVTANARGAEITVDDRTVGTAPLAEPVIVNVNPGEHKVGARAPGHQPSYRHAWATANETTKIALVLTRIEARSVAVARPTAPRATPAWVYFAPAAALAAGAGVLGALAWSSDQELDRTRSAPVDDVEAASEQSSRTRTLALATDITAGAAVVALAVGVYLAVKSSGAEPKGTSRRTNPAGPKLALGGLSLSGEF